MAVGGKGRELRYKTPEALTQKGNEYLALCAKLKEPVLYSGMLLHLNLSKTSFNEYEKRERYAEAVNLLKLAIQKEYEKLLHAGKPVGGIFALKQFGWADEGSVQTQVASLVATWAKPKEKKG